MKKVKTLIGKSGLVKGIMTLALMASVFYTAAFASFAASGKVTADTAKIRAEASTDSEVVGSTVKGKTIDILDAVKDSSGTVWYKVSVTGGGYGYIRSDLVETSDSIEVSSSSSSEAAQSQETSSEQTQKPEETVPTSIGEQQATIKSTGSVRIRSGASTAHDAVTSLPNGTVITLIGEANDSAGNKWYQMTCDYNGRTVEGYIRSDLIAIGAPQQGESSEDGNAEGENAEGENAEGETGGEGENASEEVQQEPEPEPEEEHNDYEVVYAEDPNTGESVYWLHDNVNKERQRLSELLGVAGAANENIQKLQDQVDKEKIVIIVLAVVIVVLFIIITVLALKIRSLYYEDYDEDYDEEEEEEEEEEEPAPVKKKVKKHVVQEEEEFAPVKKKKQVVKEESELYAAERKESSASQTAAKKSATRKSQNFLIDDDEFEFEFLNMDDKDL